MRRRMSYVASRHRSRCSHPSTWRRRYMSYEEEDTCHMRRRIHVICGV
jgi:hypothetical protein